MNQRNKHFLFSMISLISYNLISQNSILGSYYYSAPCIVQKLDLYSDNTGSKKINCRGNLISYNATWKTKGDTICLITEPNDTCYYVILDSLRIEQIFPNNVRLNMYFNKNIEYYQNGNIKYEIKEFYPKPISGIVNYYHDNGKLKLITNFKKGKITGDYYEFNTNGILIEKGKYRKSQKRKVVKYY